MAQTGGGGSSGWTPPDEKKKTFTDALSGFIDGMLPANAPRPRTRSQQDQDKELAGIEKSYVDEVSGPKPLGVDEGYRTVPYHGQGPYRVQPTMGPKYGLGSESIDQYGVYGFGPNPNGPNSKYYEGDEQRLIGSMSNSQRTKVQQAMEAAGLLSAREYEPGLPNEATVKAFEKILETANFQGKTWESGGAGVVAAVVAAVAAPR